MTDRTPGAGKPVALALLLSGAVLGVLILDGGVTLVVRCLLHSLVCHRSAKHLAGLYPQSTLRGALYTTYNTQLVLILKSVQFSTFYSLHVGQDRIYCIIYWDRNGKTSFLATVIKLTTFNRGKRLLTY